MSVISPTSLKSGDRILIDREVYTVVEAAMKSTAQRRGIVATRVRHIVTGKVLEKAFRSTDTVELADAEYRDMQFLYKENEAFVFMDNTNYEQHNVSQDLLGFGANFLKDGTTVKTTLFEGSVIGIELPLKMDFEVMETHDTVRGNTASNVLKDARIETGAIVKVPLFVKVGDRVRLNTTTGEYVERA